MLLRYREAQPFANEATNLLAHLAQHCILLTFGAALAIDTEISGNLGNSFLFGLCLFLGNLMVRQPCFLSSFFRRLVRPWSSSSLPAIRYRPFAPLPPFSISPLCPP